MTTFENPLTNKTLAVYTLNIYEIDGKHLAKTYVEELREHLDMLGLKRYCCRRNLISNIDMMDII